MGTFEIDRRPDFAYLVVVDFLLRIHASGRELMAYRWPGGEIGQGTLLPREEAAHLLGRMDPDKEEARALLGSLYRGGVPAWLRGRGARAELQRRALRHDLLLGGEWDEGLIFGPPPGGVPVEPELPPSDPPGVEETEWIELELLDRDGNPVANEVWRMELPDGAQRNGRTDEQGRARLEHIPGGSCAITFPNLFEDEWEEA